MCVNSSNVKSKICVSYNVKSDNDKLNSENILSMFSGELPKGFYFSTVQEKDIVYVHYYSDEYFLLSDYLSSKENCDVVFYVKEFCRFILNMGENSFLLALNQIFCDENGLYFIPSLVDSDSAEPIQALRCFLNSIADILDEYFSEIQEICSYAQSGSVTVSDVIDYIDNCDKAIIEETADEMVRRCPECGTVYEDKYVFCMKCGCKLEKIIKEYESDLHEETEKTFDENMNIGIKEQPESDEVFEKLITENDDKTEAIENFNPQKTSEKQIKRLKIKSFKCNVQKKAELTEYEVNYPAADEQENAKIEKKTISKAEQVSPDAAKSKYGETTLLGFTNYGETAVLNGMSNHFDMPNLIKKSTNEKIYISKRIFVVGKSADKADYTINNSAVSRVHAEISVVGAEYFITDKGSTNHTYVNHTEILPNSPWQIFDGDEIMFANEIFIFHFQ